MRIYLDTSAYLLAFNEEPPVSSLVQDIFDKCEEDKLTLITSLWTWSESISALDQAFKKKSTIDRPTRNSVIGTLLGKSIDLVKQKRMVLVVPTEEMIYKSWDLIRKRHLSADDALHAFTAKVGKCDLMVMADNYFADRMKGDVEMEDEPMEDDKISFEVYNIRLEGDYTLLKQKIDSL